MPELVLRRGAAIERIAFTGHPPLTDFLPELARPCGGRGVCGKCRVIVNGTSCLACQTILSEDTDVTIPQANVFTQIELGGESSVSPVAPMTGAVGAAVDIGTTTVAVRFFDLRTGETLSECGFQNPQVSYAADVMGRIGHALNGGLSSLQCCVTDSIAQTLNTFGRPVDALTVTGNTTMLYLLTGRDPVTLSRAPFRADHLFGESNSICGTNAYLPPCISAFVGADITCAVLASGMTKRSETALLIDIGTNGEIVLWKDGILRATSTAAGPVFEGAGISCGCASILGAIDHVRAENGDIRVHTIGDKPPVGVCGSGLVDAVAALLDLERIDETGACDEDDLCLCEGISLKNKDIRAVQLAKAAIAAGIGTLLEVSGLRESDVQTVYVAGGFGRHLNVRSAARIGLLPELWTERVKVIGNAALAGASMLLLNTNLRKEADAIANHTQGINLGGLPAFNNRYMEEMLFPESD